MLSKLFKGRGFQVFAAMSVITSGVVYYIHWSQTAERKRMRKGVLNDLERIRLKQQEQNLALPIKSD
jgi:hypothetical protein